MPAREKSQLVPGYGDRLLQRLRVQKWSQSELAKRTGISRQTLHRVINRDEITGRVATAIAKVLGKEFLMLPVDERERASQRAAQPMTPPAILTSPASNTWFGKVLEGLREDLQVSQEELAREAGISLNTYRRLITGANKPKSTWLTRIADALEIAEKIPYGTLLAREAPSDPLYTEIGRQLRAWRQSAGLDLHDSADMIGSSPFWVAAFEVGDEESMTFLDDLARLYGSTSDVLFRAAQLSLTPNAPADANAESINRILTFESAMTEAKRRAQWRSKAAAKDKSWDIELASKLYQRREWVGFTMSDAAKRIGTTEKLLAEWEAGAIEPSLQEFDRMSVVYRTTPWELRYGGRWERAWEFPSADESRAFIFLSVLAPGDLAWLHRFLSALADFGLSEVELEQVRDSLLSPNSYGELAEFVEIEERAVFVGARLRERAFEMWNDVRTPEWRDNSQTQIALPAICAVPIEQANSDKRILKEVWQRMNPNSAAHE